MALVAHASSGAAQTLDAAFGAGGVVTLPAAPSPYATAPGRSMSVAVQPDGRLLVAGRYATQATNFSFINSGFITRLDGRGGVDASWFGGTIARYPTPQLLVQHDGRVLTGSDNSADGPLARYGPDGALDHAFTDHAAAALASLGANFTFVDMAEQPDGKIVVIGTVQTASAYRRLALARLLADGTLDPGFVNGVRATTGAAVFSDTPTNVVLQRDGSVVVAVTTAQVQSLPGVALVRFTPDGSDDASFGVGGRVVIGGTGGGGEVAQRIATDGDGHLILATLASNWSVGSAAVVLRRFDASGGPDFTFGTQGVVARSYGPGMSSEFGALAVRADGSILLAGGNPRARKEVALLTHAGAIDPRFGVGGVLANVPLRSIADMRLTSDGGFLLAGAAAIDTPDGPVDGAASVVRYTGGIVPVVEFRHPALDHYFVTANPLEADDLDRGFHAGWQRTGQAFGAFGSDAPAGYQAACRYYIPPDKGDSHFFSASSDECAAVAAHVANDPNYAGYVSESSAAFYVALPDRVTGACPAGTVPVYRLWNQRADSNHRYTTDAATKRAMIERGYVAEGYGPDAVAMCAAQ